MTHLREPGDEERGPSLGANPALGAGEPAEKTVEDALRLPPDQRVALLEAAAVRILPRLEGVDPAAFLQSLRTAPRSDARMDWPEGDADRAESYAEVLEDLFEQPLGAQRRILELLAPRVLSGFGSSRRAKFLDDLGAKLALAAQGEDPEPLETRH